MKQKLKTLLILQVVCTFLWLVHAGYLRDSYADYKYEMGMQAGRENLHGELTSQGVAIPDGVSLMPDKELMTNLGDPLHHLFIYYPLLILQLVVLILLFRAFFYGASEVKETDEK